jgi:hypothetical protein
MTTSKENRYAPLLRPPNDAMISVARVAGGVVNNPIISSSEYLTEDAILAHWPVLSRAELRRARKSNPPKIGFYDFPKRSGGPCCTATQVQNYIDQTYLRAPCKSSDSKSEITTSTAPIPIAAEYGTPAAMTPELAQRAAEVLKREMLKRPRSSLRPSSLQPRKGPTPTPPLELVKS